MTARVTAPIKRAYPYTGGDAGSHHFDAVPAWLNDLLLEQTPGREMRNFRLAVRVAWLEDVEFHGGVRLMVVRKKVQDEGGACLAVVNTCLRRLGDPAWPASSAAEGTNGTT